ncbi:hypothetical protein NL390_29835, partial [Klebsiella pneumoniae]|nr:hypothetical protein [Klebsiella pneumoniae]
ICLENKLLNERSQFSAQATKSIVLMGLWNELPKNLTDADDINYELEKIYKRKSKAEQERLLKEAQEKQRANKGIYTEDMGKLSRGEGEQIWVRKYKPNLDMVAK